MYYLIVFILLFAAELFYFRLADRYNIIDKPNQRSSHTRITLRGGGIIFYIGAVIYFLTNGWAYPWFMLGLTLISFISFADDVRSVSQKLRLTFHMAALVLLFYQWDLFTHPWWVLLIAWLVCTGILNVYNFMDGINGITGGYSLVTLLALVYIDREVVVFIDPAFLYVMIGALLVFNWFNFRKNARCFAGDVGSVSIAFIIVFALGKLIWTTHQGSYIILLAVYGVDGVLTIFHRLLLRENILEPHRKHLYQLMANELKIPHRNVSILYMLLQTLITTGYLLLPGGGWWYTAGVVVVLSILYIGFMIKYFPLHLQASATRS